MCILLNKDISIKSNDDFIKEGEIELSTSNENYDVRKIKTKMYMNNLFILKNL